MSDSPHNQGNSHREASFQGECRRLLLGGLPWANVVRSTKGAQRTCADRSIIQNDKLFGAVTHVLIANPTEGYGIFIFPASFAVLRRHFVLCSVSRSARGAICARSLTSKLVDSASLDYRKHVKCGANAHDEGIVNEKAISFRGGLILPFLIDSHIALAKCRLVWKILLRNDRALCIHIEFQPPQQKNLLMIITFSHILFAFV